MIDAPALDAVLRHRGIALLLDRVESFDGTTLVCAGRGHGPWGWPHLLEGAAQAGGLLAGLQPDGLSRRAVVAEYAGVAIHAREHAGPVRLVARLDRRVLHFWRCRVEAHAADGTLLLEGRVTLGPEP